MMWPFSEPSVSTRPTRRLEAPNRPVCHRSNQPPEAGAPTAHDAPAPQGGGRPHIALPATAPTPPRKQVRRPPMTRPPSLFTQEIAARRFKTLRWHSLVQAFLYPRRILSSAKLARFHMGQPVPLPH